MATDKLIKELSVAGGPNRRSFLTGATMFSVGAAAMAIVDGCSGGSMMKTTPVSAAGSTDTAANILTAALIAESLAITTYYTAPPHRL